ncbi:MAG: argininosuccinate lyase [Candidatus Eisenbacteria bacterium]|nr:argininosuccinate lyase [Candidatus Eisenbacteria bacterium]
MATTDHRLWAGRLGGLDPRAQALNESLPIDRVLWPEELALARAYADSLVEAGILSSSECAALNRAVLDIQADLESGRQTLVGEDIHSAIEAELVRRAGDAGLKIHTGRSRNDQVVTLVRLRVLRLCDDTVAGLQELARALLHQAVLAGNLNAAAQTHLQPAQPVRLAHLWLAHVEAFLRDEDRFRAARESADRMPLGAGAVAGTPLVYDRGALSRRLGFTRAADNSVDAVGDRDFALDYLGAASTLAVHLSRMAEDLVLWCSPGFGWYAPPDGFSTGSSLLPQKRNPDLFELARGKSGRLIANASRLAIVLKGLPSSYQKDLQEDKEAIFDTAATLEALLGVLPAAIEALAPRPDRIREGLGDDLLAVELADLLVGRGLPFREAHSAVGRLWLAAEAARVAPSQLPSAERLSISPHFNDATLATLDHEAAVVRRNATPGGGPESVARQLARHAERLGVTPVQMTASAPAETDTPSAQSPPALAANIRLRRALPTDVPAISRLMSGHIADGTLLPRPVGELYQSVREFHVAERNGEVVGCCALRVLWDDLGEVRSLAIRSDAQGLGLGRMLVAEVVEDARPIGLERVIALTREVAFFERCGFRIVTRESLPRKVWTDCIHCPRRHACDETAVVLDLVPGATARADAAPQHWELPIPPARRPISVDADAISL